MKENLFSWKQIVFPLICLFTLIPLTAQININESFDASGLPSGWGQFGFTSSTTNACNVRSARSSVLNSSNTSRYLTSPNYIAASNGNDINISFNYKILDRTTNNPTPANFGSFQVLYSLNGSTYNVAYTINSSNHVPSTACVPVSFTIPGSNVPSGSNFSLRFLGSWANGAYYIHFDDLIAIQNTSTSPNCNAAMTAPANGATNVSVLTNSLSWSAATGLPSGYKLRVGTSPGASNIINNIDVGNVLTYPVALNYSTTYYVGITPYNANGDATGCTEYTFTTAAPVTTSTPWIEEFNTTSLPNGWLNNTFTIATSTRLPDAEGNVIFKNLNSANTTGNFSTISVGSVEAGDMLSFTYRLGNFSTPYNPPASGSGNFIIALSTDHGITYNNVQTVSNNGTAGWQDFSLDLSAYAGQFVRVKITANRTSGDYFIGFDNFYIGQDITCPTPENLNLIFASDDTAAIEWTSIANASGYNWYVFASGANPDTATPLFSGTVATTSVDIYGLSANTDYDFYVEANCGASDGLSELSEVLSFYTNCGAISNFPFTETFESNSTSLDCWSFEYVSGNTDWNVYNGSPFGTITSAYAGNSNALFFMNSFVANSTKLVTPALSISSLNTPKLSFWYANEQGPQPGDQNELRIYYKTSANGAWTLLPGAVYNSNVNNWTFVELDLPQASNQYYIAFEGTNNYGEGILLDEVTISDSEACPVTNWDGFAWSNGTPDINKKAVINGNLVLNSDLVACELEVTANGSLEIPSGFTFTVNGLITNNAAAADFVVANGANLIQVHDISNNGEITVIRESQPMKRLDYTLWSSPVENQNLFGFSPDTVNGVTNYVGSTGRIYIYNGASEYINPTPFTANAVMNEGLGYLFRSPNNYHATNETIYEGTFVGKPNNGDYSVNTVAGNFTSVGNPYPSNINADLLMGANNGISSLYFWNNTGSAGNNYASYSFIGGSPAAGGSEIPTENISVGQGFIVQTSDNAVDFDNTMRNDQASIFFRGENVIERHRIWFGFYNGDNVNFNNILMGYMTGATNGVDHQIDAVMFGYTGNAFYNVIEGGKYVNQGRALPFEVTDVVQMGIRIINAGEYKIRVTAVDGLFAEGQTIYIHDKYLNIIHNLSEQEYVFNTEVGEFDDRFDIVYQDNQTCPSQTIWDGFTWSNGLPDAETKAIIDGALIMNTDLTACELEVTTNGNLQISSGSNFTVNGQIINHAEASAFVVANGANLIQIQDIANQGNITVLRDSQPMKRLDYAMWSSPVAEQNLFGFSPDTVNGVTNYIGSTGRIYVYDGSNGYINPNPFTADAVMNEATGYLFRSPNNFDASNEEVYAGTFVGTANNGISSVNTVAGNFTSVGNPYPSNIDADLLMEANTGISTLYFWNNTGSAGNNYATYTLAGGTAAAGGSQTPNGIVSVGQGFIVSTTETSVNFDNTMRTTDNEIFFRTNEVEKHRFWLDLTNENNEKHNQILVAYMTGATQGIDAQIDGQQFGYEGSALYSIIDEDKFTIQGRALPFENSDVVKLGFKAVEAGKFIISLNHFDGLFADENTIIYLKDKSLNITHNLNESSYTFESNAGEFKDRFEIVYEEESTMGTDDLTANDIQVYTQNQNIFVNSKTEKIIAVELYDLSGRTLHSNHQVNANLYQIQSYNKGVLVVKVQTQNGEILTKKVITK